MAEVDIESRDPSRELLALLQRNIRKFLMFRNWGWFSIIQKTRPLIGMINIEEEIRILEEAAESACSAVENEQVEKKRLEEENVRIQEEKDKIKKRIETEQGDLAIYQEKQAKAAAQKAELEIQLMENRAKLEQEQERRDQLSSSKRTLETEAASVRKDATELEDQVIFPEL